MWDADHLPPSSAEIKNSWAIPALPHTSSWLGLQLNKQMDDFNHHLIHVVVNPTSYWRDAGSEYSPEVGYCDRFFVILSWVVTLCSLLLGCWRFGGKCRPHFHGRRVVYSCRRLPKWRKGMLHPSWQFKVFWCSWKRRQWPSALK
jgi:hypothetical protein